jgi:protein-S-isoprenylcysteine O-methyltransferase Ste14
MARLYLRNSIYRDPLGSVPRRALKKTRGAMTIRGAGPKIMISGAACAALGGVLSYSYPQYFIIRIVPYRILACAGIVLIAVGTPMAIWSVCAVIKAFAAGKLVTKGPYAWSRNPLYAAFILFVTPGIMLLFKSWLMLGTPLVMYVVFKLLIKTETDYLRAKFGDDFARYESSVNELFPWPRRNPK